MDVPCHLKVNKRVCAAWEVTQRHSTKHSPHIKHPTPSSSSSLPPREARALNVRPPLQVRAPEFCPLPLQTYTDIQSIDYIRIPF